MNPPKYPKNSQFFLMPLIGVSDRERFINCDLENLEYIVIDGEISRMVNEFSCIMTAKLPRPVLTTMSIERFNAEKYPKLMNLVLNECDLRSLKLRGCPSLSYIDICKNPYLIEVESD